jgi:4-HFC-P synthase
LDAPREPDGVTFADQRPNDALIGLMAQSGFAGAMVDTARKNGGRLLYHEASHAFVATVMGIVVESAMLNPSVTTTLLPAVLDEATLIA